MATIHPDYERPLSDKLKALGAKTYSSGTANIMAVNLEPRGGRGKPRYADIVMTQGFTDGAETHTVRVWRHGPISLLDCTHGTISQQDTMRLFGAENDCPMCTTLVQHIRAHRGWHDARWVMQGYAHRVADMVMAFRPQLMTLNHATGRWEQRGELRKSRDREREAYLMTHPSGDYAAKVRGVITYALNNTRAQTVADWNVRATVSTGYSASATCYKKGWGKADKRLGLTVPPAWLRVYRECGGVMDGYIVGAILSQTADTMVRWAIKPMSPVDRTTWWRASFTRINASDPTAPQWRFDRFIRNGAMGGDK